MQIIGYLLLVFMGLTLGLIGAGGSILTIPILVYFFGMSIIKATTYSLVIVGINAFVGMLRYKHEVPLKKVALFVLPSMIGVFVARSVILPNLPRSFGLFTLEQLLTFLLLTFMFLASYFMIKVTGFRAKRVKNFSMQWMQVIGTGLVLGLILGIIGAGGGFLIIPVLILLMNFSMQEAVPASLFIITINSLVGFISDPYHIGLNDWWNLFNYLAFALVGMFCGIRLVGYLKGEMLKQFFGWFVAIVATTMLFREFIL